MGLHVSATFDLWLKADIVQHIVNLEVGMLTKNSDFSKEIAHFSGLRVGPAFDLRLKADIMHHTVNVGVDMLTKTLILARRCSLFGSPCWCCV